VDSPAVDLLGRGWFDGLALAASLASILALVITAYAARKIRSVATVQREEREVVRTLFGIDEIHDDLLRASAMLRESESPRADVIATKLTVAAGKLEGIGRALDHLDDSPTARPNAAKSVGLSLGYCSGEFFCEMANSSTEWLDILLYRNKQAHAVDVIEEFQRTCDRGVPIRLLALHSAAPSVVLQHSARMIPRPSVADAGDLSMQLREGESRIREIVERDWPENEARLFEYRAYDTMPAGHFFIVDGWVSTGFLHTGGSGQPEHAADRPYQTFDPASPVAVQMKATFEALWKESAGNVIVAPGPQGGEAGAAGAGSESTA
jgi:hypothetical protein